MSVSHGFDAVLDDMPEVWIMSRRDGPYVQMSSFCGLVAAVTRLNFVHLIGMVGSRPALLSRWKGERIAWDDEGFLYIDGREVGVIAKENNASRQHHHWVWSKGGSGEGFCIAGIRSMLRGSSSQEGVISSVTCCWCVQEHAMGEEGRLTLATEEDADSEANYMKRERGEEKVVRSVWGGAVVEDGGLRWGKRREGGKWELMEDVERGGGGGGGGWEGRREDGQWARGRGREGQMMTSEQNKEREIRYQNEKSNKTNTNDDDGKKYLGFGLYWDSSTRCVRYVGRDDDDDVAWSGNYDSEWKVMVCTSPHECVCMCVADQRPLLKVLRQPLPTYPLPSVELNPTLYCRCSQLIMNAIVKKQSKIQLDQLKRDGEEDALYLLNAIATCRRLDQHQWNQLLPSPIDSFHTALSLSPHLASLCLPLACHPSDPSLAQHLQQQLTSHMLHYSLYTHACQTLRWSFESFPPPRHTSLQHSPVFLSFSHHMRHLLLHHRPLSMLVLLSQLLQHHIHHNDDDDFVQHLESSVCPLPSPSQVWPLIMTLHQSLNAPLPHLISNQLHLPLSKPASHLLNTLITSNSLKKLALLMCSTLLLKPRRVSDALKQLSQEEQEAYCNHAPQEYAPFVQIVRNALLKL